MQRYRTWVALLSVAPSIFSTAACRAENGVLPADEQALIRDLESKSWVAWKAQDAKFFEQFLSNDHVEVHGYGVVGKAAVVGAIRKAACSVASYSLGPLTIVQASSDSVLVTYRAEQSTKCGNATVPSPVWATSVYVKRAGTWLNILYQQTPAM